LNPSENSSEYPSMGPTQIRTNLPSMVPATKCADLPKFKCRQRTEDCILISQPAKVGSCTLKKPKFEHDCSKYTNEAKCTKKSKFLCTFTSGKCIHVCNVEQKKVCNQLKAKNKKPCKYKNAKNPCLGCHPAPVC